MGQHVGKADKLVALADLVELETGTLHEDRFTYENDLYVKAVQYKRLVRQQRVCRSCPDMNIPSFTQGCAGWGNLNAKIFFVGQSLHEAGMLSALPFIKGSGYSIDAALFLSGLRRHDCFFSNVVHCHPQNNRPSTDEEKSNCRQFLLRELNLVQPKLIVAMGNDAKVASVEWVESFEAWEEKPPKIYRCKHPATFMYAAPEQRVDWIIKLSLRMDKVL